MALIPPAHFPFVIDGVVERLEINVINGFCPHAADPATIDAEPWRWSTDDPLIARIVALATAETTRVHRCAKWHYVALSGIAWQVAPVIAVAGLMRQVRTPARSHRDERSGRVIAARGINPHLRGNGVRRLLPR